MEEEKEEKEEEGGEGGEGEGVLRPRRAAGTIPIVDDCAVRIKSSNSLKSGSSTDLNASYVNLIR